MKFTVKWLKKYVDVNLPVADIADRLTMLGLEVDAVDELGGGLDNVVVARVESVAKHPNADKLSICQVSIGSEIKKIVCGAPNVRPGMISALALPGANLPGGFKVKPAKIRGESSDGMLCSEKELQISEGQAGIMDLSEDLSLGMPITEALDLHDTMVEVDLTPNRPDCTSVIGVAREIAGFTGGKLIKPVNPAELPSLTGSDSFAIDVVDAGACPRYSARLLKNVTIAPSPWWLKRILLAVGLRPINNVVDITNFVMLEYGQPLHAFDFKKLADSKIVVRKANAGEKITTLDGVERDLDEEMLLICDGQKPVAVAGVMGGENSEVSADTSEVLLESAYFNPVSIRRTNRLLKLGTDASYRFERGVDPQGTVVALERAAQLICEICGAEVEEGGVDICGEIKPPATINLRVGRTSDLLGMAFTAEELEGFLNGIEIETEKIDDNTIKVTPPTFRVDLEREVDLIEEIARLKGYNDIPTSLPVVPMSFSEQEPARQMRHQLAGVMISQGYNEAINYSFTGRQNFDLLGLAADDPLRSTVDLLNPLTEEQGVMRTSLLPGLLENVRHNINRQNIDGRLFEVGKVFHPQKGQELPCEIVRLTAVCTGRRQPGSSLLYYGDEKADIYDVMGVAQQLFDQLNIKAPLMLKDLALSYVEDGEFLVISHEEKVVGNLGKIAKSVLKQFSIKQDVYFLDINVSFLQDLPRKPIVFKALSKYPAVKWDLAVVVADQVGGGEMISKILSSNKPYVENAEIFDIYRGDHVEKGFKSVAIKITYHSGEQTLDDETVGAVHQEIIDLLLSSFDGQLREM